MLHRILLAALLCASAAPATELQLRAKNQNLEHARALVGMARWEEALEELFVAASLPGNTPRHVADIEALRASALLGLPPSPERRGQAADALVELWHVDPEGTALAQATESARALALEVRASRTLLLHDRLVTVRTGRPLQLRARLAGASVGDMTVQLHYRVEPSEEFITVPLERRADGAFEAYLRPGVGGVPAEGSHVLDYFLDARGAGDVLLDSNGSERAPIRVQLSPTQAEGEGVDGAKTLLALDEGGVMAHPPPPPPPAPPWYKRWQVLAPIGGALVVGGVVAAALLTPKSQPATGTLGRVDLP